MYESFTDVVDIIDINLKNNKTVIVHCFAGIQRSAAVICGYLMIHGYTLEDAILHQPKRKMRQDCYKKYNNLNFSY